MSRYFLINMKKALLILFLSSCTADLTYFNIAREAFSSSRIDINDTFIENVGYSFIKATLGRNEATFVLSEVRDNDVYIWIGANLEEIHTYMGFIVFTKGFNPEFRLPFIEDFRDLDLFSNSSSTLNLYLKISEPKLEIVEMNLDFYHDSETECTKILTRVEAIKFSGTSEVCYLNGFPKTTTQKISPLHKEIILEFYI